MSNEKCCVPTLPKFFRHVTGNTLFFYLAYSKELRGANIRIYHECEGRIEKYVPKITVWHHEAWRVMTNGDPPDGFFYPTLTRIMDSLSCSKLFFFLLF